MLFSKNDLFLQSEGGGLQTIYNSTNGNLLLKDQASGQCAANVGWPPLNDKIPLSVLIMQNLY